ncbi:hypothetical protein GNI_077160, partial [Gregarina niphandrodes]
MTIPCDGVGEDSKGEAVKEEAGTSEQGAKEEASSKSGSAGVDEVRFPKKALYRQRAVRSTM